MNETEDKDIYKQNASDLRDFGVDQREFEDFTEGTKAFKSAINEWEDQNPDKRTEIIIAGATATGKDTFISKLEFDPDDTTQLSLDRYYLGAELMKKKYDYVNFSIPEALDRERINRDIENIRNAKEGDKVSVPIYNMKESKRTGEELITVKKRLIVEGVYGIDQFDSDSPLKAYLQTDDGVILQRKLNRDVKERNVPKETVIKRFNDNVLPAIRNYVEPQRDKARIVIKNNEDLEEYR
ncbi:MAG: hypothetical protein V1838_04345 [Patescibacteria group bacterium]